MASAHRADELNFRNLTDHRNPLTPNNMNMTASNFEIDESHSDTTPPTVASTEKAHTIDATNTSSRTISNLHGNRAGLGRATHPAHTVDYYITRSNPRAELHVLQTGWRG
jgi:hypothetical protein